MNIASELKALRRQSTDLSINERAELACRLAKQLEKAGEYEAAFQALREFWPNGDEAPTLTGLTDTAKAEMLLRCGALVRCLGGSKAVARQDTAKNLITQAIELFEHLGIS